jgi:nickel-dependent lactate racemase
LKLSTLTQAEIQDIVESALQPLLRTARVLVIHPDYSRTDCTDKIARAALESLRSRGLRTLDAFNSAGTHRKMTREETLAKLGFSDATPCLGTLFSHEYDDAAQLTEVGELPADFIAAETAGGINQSIPVTANSNIFTGYDLVICIAATKPHEAAGFAGGTKLLVPGIVGGDVTASFHWAAAMVGLPNILGQADNPARRIIDRAAGMIMERLGDTPILLLNMVCGEDEQGGMAIRGLFAGFGMEGFKEAFARSVELSKELHFIKVPLPLTRVVQRMHSVYDEIWTAGKGSYYLQIPGVLAPDAEVTIFAPHIHAFHSNASMDAAIREIGYHGREYVLDFLTRNPGFNLNIASHVMNVRGVNEDFRVTLATGISEAECEAAGLGYLDPASVRREDFEGSQQLWVDHGGLWTYVRE